MSKLFTLKTTPNLYRWPKINKLKNVVNEMLLEPMDLADEIDIRTTLLDTYNTFSRAAEYDIKGVDLTHIDAQNLCVLYVNRTLIEDEIGQFTNSFDRFLQLYIQENIHRCLDYAISLFFSFYESTKIYIEKLGKIISEALEISLSHRFKYWKRHCEIFQSNPNEYIISLLEQGDYSFQFILDELGLVKETHINSPFMEYAALSIFKSEKLDWQQKISLLEEIFYNNRYEASLPHAINAIFEDPSIRNSIIYKEEFASDEITQVLSFLIKRWGDPRANSFENGKWVYIDLELKDYFRFILAKDDLEIFFKITDELNRDNNWPYRKKFWEAYLPYIRRTHVMLGKEGQLLATRYNNRNEANTLRFGQLSNRNKNAFIMQIGTAVLLEWSDNGRLYIIPNCSKNAVEYFFSLSDMSENDLKYEFRTSWIDPIRHISPDTYSWQRKVAALLRDVLRVTPKSTYRFDRQSY